MLHALMMTGINWLKKSIRIDHHVQVETICDEEWIDDKASATCELLALYLQKKKG